MITRLAVTLVVGALLSVSGLAYADVPICSAYKHRERLTPATASLTMPMNRHPILDSGAVVTKRFIVYGRTVWGTMIDRRGATLEGGRGTINQKRDVVEIMSRETIDASSADAWGRPENVTGLSWVLAQRQTAKPPREPKADFIKPVLYSSSLMAVGFGIFVVSGILENDPSANNFIKSYKSPPRFEDDPPLFNFVLHPLWGSETYLRAREAHFGIPGSIAFSMGASIAWEYLYESWTQHPSAQDLIFTTGIGWMIGEGRYYLKNKLGPENYWWIDPIHTALEYFNIGVNQDSEGNTQTTLHLTWKF